MIIVKRGDGDNMHKNGFLLSVGQRRKNVDGMGSKNLSSLIKEV